MKITVLIENTAECGFECEHGLSFYIEHNGRRHLIDTGTTALFAENAKRLGIDLSGVDAAYLSHAHYDHSGGFPAFFGINAAATVYLQEACRTRRYFEREDGDLRYIGIPDGILDEYGDRFVYINGYRDMGDGVHICPHTTPGLEKRGERASMYGVNDGGTAYDRFDHEQTVVFEEDDGLCLFNSCSHGGVENIIDEVKACFPARRIKAFFGGFHMMGASGVDSCAFGDAELCDIARRLLDGSDAIFYTGHCTGNIATARLCELMGDRLVRLHSGLDVVV